MSVGSTRNGGLAEPRTDLAETPNLVHLPPTMDHHDPDPAQRVRCELDRLVARSRTPGIQYMVVDAASTRFAYYGGSADLRGSEPMRPATTMMAYSMSKTITAAAVLRLVAARQVRLEDPVARYVAALPYHAAITIRQLLSHTSGIPNPIPLRWIHQAARHDTFDEHVALATVLRKHPRLASPPGTKYRYSNIGYWLLGSVVEHTSGEPFTAYVTREVLEPLGVTPRELGYEIPNFALHAAGYLEKYSLLNLMKGLVIDPAFIGAYDGSWLRIAPHYPDGAAFGGLVGTAAGFGKFLADQLRHPSLVLDDATRKLFYAPQRTRRGTTVPMTLGWHIGRLDGRQFFYKEGGGGGFHCMMRVYRDRGIASVMMTNATGFDVRRGLNTLDRAFLR
jgi:D-alanyl-D-alanine carboxypeptidase